MSMSTPLTPETTINCEYKDPDKVPCSQGSHYKEHEGRRYCVLHFPGKEKGKEFNEVLLSMIKSEDYNFSGVWFPEGQWFRRYEFNKPANFHGAYFSAKADFYSTKFFQGVNFRHAIFSDKADFSSAIFEVKANFTHTKFNASADFKRAAFKAQANFKYATFRGDARFSHEEEEGRSPRGEISSLNLRYAIIDKPQSVSFHNLTLAPRWFVDVDPRKFDFTQVTWMRVSPEKRGKNILKDINDEIAGLKGVVSRPYSSLSITSHRLAVNAEENNRYDEASVLRYWSMEALRLGKKHGEHDPGKLHRLYHFVSGYGERIGRAFIILLAIWVLFALLYMLTGHIKMQELRGLKGHLNLFNRSPQEFVDAFNYSLRVITLQKPDKPSISGYIIPALVTLETILGPLQTALLALAIRRKFMR